MIACALIPRFALLATLEGRRELLFRPLALAPEPGGPQVIGEVSGPAEAFGIRAGMRLGEALARYPALTLVPPDPERAESAWERALRQLEGIGAGGRAGASRRGLLRGGRPAWACGEAWSGCCSGRGEAVGSGRAARGGTDPALRLCGRAPGATAPGADDRPRRR